MPDELDIEVVDKTIEGAAEAVDTILSEMIRQEVRKVIARELFFRLKVDNERWHDRLRIGWSLSFGDNYICSGEEYIPYPKLSFP